ncbi:MAG: N-acetyltransferase [Calditrichaeota bacterium]|nr:MAG: N-acetyltransferase [Calditrichota bacterium]MBL1206975.1 N-acetyltransferase [Calditrichota bacterium]NOG46802.1 GNAT family N-acetyltransferase [Calditrichota bacterium]
MEKYIFKSERLGFRYWKDSDLKPFADMTADAEIMKYYPKILTFAESGNLIEKIKQHFDINGFGLHAVDILESNKFIGYIGFMKPSFESFFTPCTEIGWRLSKEEWNNGFATEGAERCLEFGFKELGFSEIYSFTSTVNKASERVMQKIGMQKIGEFDHPNLDNKSQLKRHVLYVIRGTYE